MEDPSTWGLAERAVAQAIKEHSKATAAGVIGRSQVRAITDALRDVGLLINSEDRPGG